MREGLESMEDSLAHAAGDMAKADAIGLQACVNENSTLMCINPSFVTI